MEAGPAWLGHGTAERPLYAFGDGSGGPDTHDIRLRRVGIAVCVITSFTPFEVGPFLMGPLAGGIQTVPKGEITALELAIRRSSGVLIFTTDCAEVCRGWWEQLYRHPAGVHAGLW